MNLRKLMRKQLMTNFIVNLNDRLNSLVFFVEKKREFNLEEKGKYKLTVTQDKNASLIVIRPSEMKSRAKYLKSNNLPKDCDYILINPEKEVLFFIELKSSSKTSTNNDIKKQLIAGKKWFDHILFITDLSFDEIKKFRVISICIQVNNRTDYKNGRKFNVNNNIYKVNGKEIDLREFYRNKQCNILFENFEKKFNT